MNIDDYFDAQYEAGISTSAYHKAKYGYLGEWDGSDVQSSVLRDDRRVFRSPSKETSDRGTVSRWGEQAYFDSDAVMERIDALGLTRMDVAKMLKVKSTSSFYQTLNSGRTALDRLVALCAVLNLDVKEVIL